MTLRESGSLSLMESHGRLPVMSESLIVPELEWEPLSVDGPWRFDLQAMSLPRRLEP